MTLIGPAIDLMPYLIQTMDQAGERGIGRSGGRFALRRLLAEPVLGSDQWESVYDTECGQVRRLAGSSPDGEWPAPAGRLSLRFQTPLRIKRRGHFVGTQEIAAEDLLRNLLARLASLADFYGDRAAAGLPDWNRLAPAARDVQLTSQSLRWLDWTRYSSRQHTTMQLGGLVGELTLDGPGLAAFGRALWLGQWTHLGKGTSFGLGKYRLSPADRSTPAPAGPSPSENR
jgi:hypothetical protein